MTVSELINTVMNWPAYYLIYVAIALFVVRFISGLMLGAVIGLWTAFTNP